MLCEIPLNSLRENEFFSRKFKVLCENLNRVVDSAVRAPAKHAVDGIAQRAAFTDHVRLKLIFAVIFDRMRGTLRHFEADADPEHTSGLLLKLHGLQIFVERIGNLAKDKRICEVKLLLRPESTVISPVSAVWTVARGRL